MSQIFKEENNSYQIDFSLTEWCTDDIHDVFHRAKVELSDVDFVGETVSDIFLVEYKNANIPGAANSGAFMPQVKKQLIKEFQVLSIAEWNAHPTYSKFPLSKCGIV